MSGNTANRFTSSRFLSRQTSIRFGSRLLAATSSSETESAVQSILPTTTPIEAAKRSCFSRSVLL